MGFIFSLLASLTSIYLLLIFIRIMLTWFSGANFGKPEAVLSSITDPFLNWFKRFPGLRIGGFLDLSPIAAMAVLSVANNVFMMIARYGSISIGRVFAMVLGAVWSAASFILGFIAIILGLRLFAYLTNQNTFGTFWRIIDAISQPILFRTKQFLFRGKTVDYRTEIISSLGVFVVALIGGGILVHIASRILERLPI
jgi:YggT family protein